MARPSTFSQEVAIKILDRISEGEMLIKICQEDEMPPRKTFYTWMVSRPSLQEAYARARLAWADWWAEKVLAISLDSSGDIFIDDNGKAVIDHANVQRARLQSDNIKWLVGKYAPRTYGDKPALDTPAEVRHVTYSWQAADPKPQPALPQITYDPGPLPKRIDPEIIARFLRMIKDTVPRADQRAPEEVLSLALDVCERALKAEFAPDVV